MSASVQIKRFDAIPSCPAFMSVYVQDGPALIKGNVWLGDKPRIGTFTVHMMNRSFGAYHNVLGSMSAEDAESFLQMLLGPLDFARPAAKVAA